MNQDSPRAGTDLMGTEQGRETGDSQLRVTVLNVVRTVLTIEKTNLTEVCHRHYNQGMSGTCSRSLRNPSILWEAVLSTSSAEKSK